MKDTASCQYFSKGLCNALVLKKFGDEGKITREELCHNAQKLSCCYECETQTSCEISCNFLGTTEEENIPETPSGMISATALLREPEIMNLIKSKYTIIFDQALLSMKFDNIVRAINLMAVSGWKCINITSYNNAGAGQHVQIPMVGQLLSQSIYMYALMEKVGS